MLDHYLFRDVDLANDPLAAGDQVVDERGLLVSGDVSVQIEVTNCIHLGEYPVGCRVCTHADHILSGGIAGEVVESNVYEPAGHIFLYGQELCNL